MANQGLDKETTFLNPWRLIGWSIPAILLIAPAVAMRYTSEVNWAPSDFAIMGAIFAAIGLGIEFLIRQSEQLAYRIASVVASATAFLTIWVNLAVGMIGDDNPYNLLFGGVLLVALSGAVLALFRAAGMARTMFATAAAQLLVSVGGLTTDPRGAGLSLAFALPWWFAGILFRAAAREG